VIGRALRFGSFSRFKSFRVSDPTARAVSLPNGAQSSRASVDTQNRLDEVAGLDRDELTGYRRSRSCVLEVVVADARAANLIEIAHLEAEWRLYRTTLRRSKALTLSVLVSPWCPLSPLCPSGLRAASSRCTEKHDLNSIALEAGVRVRLGIWKGAGHLEAEMLGIPVRGVTDMIPSGCRRAWCRPIRLAVSCSPSSPLYPLYPLCP
jgi:hypothetical protein